MTAKKTTEQFIQEARLIHGNRYGYDKTIYTGKDNHVIVTCYDHGDFPVVASNHLHCSEGGKVHDCPKCRKNKPKGGKKQFTNEYIDKFLLDHNISLIRVGNYITTMVKIDWKCLKCGLIWPALPNNILRDHGCRDCGHFKLNNNDIDHHIIFYDLKIKRIGDYINNYTEIEWVCLICNNNFRSSPTNILRNIDDRINCSVCSRFANEKRVGEVLEKLGIETQKLCIDLPEKRMYPDYFLPQLNTIIEYNGEQHYGPVSFGNKSEEKVQKDFIKQQVRDQLMREYCAENNINLLEIDGRKYKGDKLKKFVFEFFEGKWQL